MTPLIAATSVVLAGIAGLCIYFAFRPPTLPTSGMRRTATKRALTRPERLRLLAGLSIGLLLYLYTGWVLTIIAAPAAAYLLPKVLTNRDQVSTTERLEAVESWLRALGGVIIASMPLEEAIRTTASRAPEVIKRDVQQLSTRILNRTPPAAALRAFADAIGDSSVDTAITHLIRGAELRGPGLADMLTTTADAIHDEITVVRNIESHRAGSRRTMQIIAIGIGVLFAIVTLTSPLPDSFFAPYRTPTGQAALLIWLLLFAAAVRGAYVVSKPTPIPRILGGTTRATTKRNLFDTQGKPR